MTQTTRWLIFLLSGTFAFGLFCFRFGLLLGLYFGGERSAALLPPRSFAHMQDRAYLSI
jgi:hypothetical protein